VIFSRNFGAKVKWFSNPFLTSKIKSVTNECVKITTPKMGAVENCGNHITYGRLYIQVLAILLNSQRVYKREVHYSSRRVDAAANFAKTIEIHQKHGFSRSV
jgi:hypothetical protein